MLFVPGENMVDDGRYADGGAVCTGDVWGQRGSDS